MECIGASVGMVNPSVGSIETDNEDDEGDNEDDETRDDDSDGEGLHAEPVQTSGNSVLPASILSSTCRHGKYRLKVLISESNAN